MHKGYQIKGFESCVLSFQQMKYKELWETEKVNIHLPHDTPNLELSKANAVNISNVRFVLMPSLYSLVKILEINILNVDMLLVVCPSTKVRLI